MKSYLAAQVAELPFWYAEITRNFHSEPLGISPMVLVSECPFLKKKKKKKKIAKKIKNTHIHGLLVD